MEKRIAIVIGATGLVGSALVQQLLRDDRFGLIRIFGRRSTGLKHEKLEEHIINFDKPSEWKELVKGDVLFSTLGTTLKQAGSKEAQYKVDHDYQYVMALAASENGVPVYVLVSAAMASTQSRIFYSRMKGELERDIRHLAFQHIHILQPGILKGDRKESRPAEKIGISLVEFLNRLGIAKKQRPIDVSIVAKAMISVSFHEERIKTYELVEVFHAAGIN